MAGSVNKVILIGNLGADPELRYTSGGKAVANFRIATSESFGKGQDRQEATEWHNVVVWEKLAELCGEYLSKGRKVYVEGRLTTRKWTDKDNNERYTTEIVAREVVFLSGPGDNAGGGGGPRPPRPQREGGYGGGGYQDRSAPSNVPSDPPPPFEDDDIPF